METRKSTRRHVSESRGWCQRLAHPETGPLLGPVREREGRGMRGLMAIATLLVMGVGAAVPAAAQTKIVMGWCSRTISSATAPFAIATKMGWYKAEGIEVELMPLPGSGDWLKNVATREVLAALPSAEPLAVGRPHGITANSF